MKNIFLFILCFTSLIASEKSGLTKLKSELNIYNGMIQRNISSESMHYICKSPSKEIKTAMMEVFTKQINANVGHTSKITMKDAELITDSYIYGAKNGICPPGFKLSSPCGMCQSGAYYNIVHR